MTTLKEELEAEIKAMENRFNLLIIQRDQYVESGRFSEAQSKQDKAETFKLVIQRLKLLIK